MIFYVQYEHMMSSSGLIGFTGILKGVGSGRPQDYEQFWELRKNRLRYEDMPKISPRRWRVFWYGSVRTMGHRLATDKGTVSPLFLLIAPNGAEGGSVCVSRGLTLASQITRYGCKV